MRFMCALSVRFGFLVVPVGLMKDVFFVLVGCEPVLRGDLCYNVFFVDMFLVLVCMSRAWGVTT